jgi:CRISPR-associated endoribonuclease Cas6
MPHSLVLNLVPQSDISPNYLDGRHLHALFLSLVSCVDRDLGDRLHESTSQKAFTLSNLQVAKKRGIPKTLQWQHRRPIPAGTPCWWRISLLDDRLFGQLGRLWLNLDLDRSWHLGAADLTLASILGTPQAKHPWTNACSYEQLYEQASDRDRQIAFSLATPTAFRQGKYDCALPTRDLVFYSLLSRWNRYSGIELTDPEIDAIFPSFFDIRTEITVTSRTKFIGCIGEISYRLLGDIDPIKIKQINALADFAIYCGIGRKTTMGMGMARRMNH